MGDSMGSKKAKSKGPKPDDDKQNSSAEPPDRPIRIDEYIDDKYDVRELDGRRGVTRDNEVHGSGFLDNVDRAEDALR